MKNRFLLFSLVSLLALGCEQIELIPTPGKEEAPTQPAGYERFLHAYKSGYGFTSIEVEEDSIRVVFDGGINIGYEAAMATADIVVDDCSSSEPKICAVDENGKWMVGGVATRIPSDNSLLDAEAIPFYIAYEPDKTLRIRISNGNTLKYEYVDSRFRGDIPKIYLTTDDAREITSKEEYKTGKIKILDPDHKFWDTPEWSATMRIKGRGNSTWGMPKKPYKIKLDSKAKLFDMSNDKEWCLLANYCDKSLMRNLTAMELSRRLGFSWTPKMVSVEVYLNGRYDGVYAFCEHKKVSSERVNINIDGGDMYFEIESNQDEIACWWTEHSCPMMFSEPSEPTAEQFEEAKAFFKGFEDNLWAKNFNVVYDKYIDKASFVDYFIIQELTKNCDGNLRKSTFLTLPKGGKLEMYHVWDFDISMGNCDYYGDGKQPWEGWWIKDQSAIGWGHGWYYRLFMDPSFVADVKARWNEMYPQFESIPDWIRDEVKMLGDAPTRNFQRWNILNSYVWPNYKVTGSYNGEVNWLIDAYTKRLSWMDTNLKTL